MVKHVKKLNNSRRCNTAYLCLFTGWRDESK